MSKKSSSRHIVKVVISTILAATSLFLILLIERVSSYFWVGFVFLGIALTLGLVAGIRQSGKVGTLAALAFFLGHFVIAYVGYKIKITGVLILLWVMGMVSGSFLGDAIISMMSPRVRQNVRGPLRLHYVEEPTVRSSSFSEPNVKKSICTLNGKSPWGVTICLMGKRMDVCGSRDRLMVYVNLTQGDDKTWHYLCNPEGGEEDCSVKFGDIVGTFQGFQVVDAELAVAAAEFFLKNKDLNPELEWRVSPHVWDMRPPGII